MDFGGVSDMGARGSIVIPTLAAIVGAHPRTSYRVECVRQGKVIWVEEFENLVTDVGKEHILRRTIMGGTQPAFNGASSTTGRSYPDGRLAPRVWATGTKAVGDICQPTVPNGHIYICVVGGASSGSEPTWPTGGGSTVVDNAATWLEASQLYIGLKGAGTELAADTMASHSSWSEHLAGTVYSGNRKPYVPAAPTTGSTSNTGSVASFSITAAGPTTVVGAFLCDMPGNAISSNTIGVLYGVGPFTNSRDVYSGDTLNVTVTTSIT